MASATSPRGAGQLLGWSFLYLYFGGLDILVNNAGIANMKGPEQTSEEEWDAIVNVNQKGVWLGMKTAVPVMRKRGGGSIINISSIQCIGLRAWSAASGR
jgi:NAD(P)-dependent dehydrogenase (short-subunit alcohol dehydrogenase family)